MYPVLYELVDECDVVVSPCAAVEFVSLLKAPVRTIETNVRGKEGRLQASWKKKKIVVRASPVEVYRKKRQQGGYPFAKKTMTY